MKPSEIFEGENSGLRKSFDEAVARGETNADKLNIVHFGGESKEVIEAEDRWHEEQRNKTDKILAEFESFYSFFAGLPVQEEKNAIKLYEKYVQSFLTSKINQAKAEERARVMGEIEKYIPNGSILDISGIKKDIIDRLSLLDDTKTNG